MAISNWLTAVSLGEYLRKHRLQRVDSRGLAWSQNELARRSCVDRGYLSKIENDLSVPGDVAFVRLADAFEWNDRELEYAYALVGKLLPVRIECLVFDTLGVRHKSFRELQGEWMGNIRLESDD